MINRAFSCYRFEIPSKRLIISEKKRKRKIKETRILFQQRYTTTEDKRINHNINALRCQLANDHSILHM